MPIGRSAPPGNAKLLIGRSHTSQSAESKPSTCASVRSAQLPTFLQRQSPAQLQSFSPKSFPAAEPSCNRLPPHRRASHRASSVQSKLFPISKPPKHLPDQISDSTKPLRLRDDSYFRGSNRRHN